MDEIAHLAGAPGEPVIPDELRSLALFDEPELQRQFVNESADKASGKPVREASEKCQQDAQKFLSELELDRKVYDALAAVDATKLDPAAARFLKLTLPGMFESSEGSD